MVFTLGSIFIVNTDDHDTLHSDRALKVPYAAKINPRNKVGGEIDDKMFSFNYSASLFFFVVFQIELWYFENAR